MNADQFRQHVIRPTLRELGLWSMPAERLMIGTALVESNLEFLVQHGGGPARSVFQIERATFDDIMGRYLQPARRSELKTKILALTVPAFDPWDQITGNHYLACAIARVRYWMVPAGLPEADDYLGLAEYHKKWYNTPLGAAKVEETVVIFKRIIEEAHMA